MRIAVIDKIMASPSNPVRSPRVVNIHHLRQLAKKRLPGAVFDYLDGSADDERTLTENRHVLLATFNGQPVAEGYYGNIDNRSSTFYSGKFKNGRGGELRALNQHIADSSRP